MASNVPDNKLPFRETHGGQIQPFLVGSSSAATLLGISKSFWHELLSTRRIDIKPICLGAKRLWLVESLQEFCRTEFNKVNKV